MQAVVRRSILALVVIALIAGVAGLRAEVRLPPESVGFSADGLKAFQRTMRAGGRGQARRCHDARRTTRQARASTRSVQDLETRNRSQRTQSFAFSR
jgi:hypothetical protein